MNRTTFLAAAGGALAMTSFALPARAAESAVSLQTGSGALFGTLTLPASAPPYPVVLIIAGSGPTDRDGNSPPQLDANAYALLAAALAKDGVATLRYDKRGVAASLAAGPKESDLRFDMYVDDAAAWVKWLGADKRFSNVTIAGHSEGALIGTIVAERTPVHALVLLEGAGRPASTILREQLERQLPPELYVRVNAALTQLQAGHTVVNTPAELNALLRPSLQPYLISWFKYDPAAELSKVRVPVTIVQGTADIQVSMTDAQALQRALPSAKLVVVNGMNHVLKHAPDHSSMQAVLKAYADPSLPIDPQVVQAVEAAAKS